MPREKISQATLERWRERRQRRRQRRHEQHQTYKHQRQIALAAFGTLVPVKG